jgi:hypothetical protein
MSLNNLEVLLNTSNLNILYYKLQYSIDEIKAKNPHRLDLIDSMERSQTHVAEAILLILEMEKSLLSNDRFILSLKKWNLELKINNNKLEKQNKELIKYVEI